MSGSLRIKLAPTKKRLTQYMQNPTETPENIPQLPEEAIVVYEQYFEVLDVRITEIQDAVDKLSAISDEWRCLIQKITDSTRYEQELNLYEQTSIEDDGFLSVLEKGRGELIKYKAEKSRVERKLQQLWPQVLGNQTFLPSNQTFYQPDESSQPAAPPAAPIMKLPAIQLKKFDGQLKNWNEFWSLFEAAVDAQKIPTVHKLTYLLSLLQGEAKAITEGYSVREENYSVVIDVLKNNFAKDDWLRTSLHAELTDLPPAQKMTELGNSVNHIERILRKLEGMGEDVHTRPFEILILKKLPYNVLKDILKKQAHDQTWTVQKLRKHLLTTVAIQKQLEVTLGTLSTKVREAKPVYPNRAHNRFPTGSENVNEQQHSSALATQEISRTENRTVVGRKTSSCIFCNEMHTSCKCTKYPTVRQRQEKAKELKICLRCLRRGHLIRNCQTQLQPCLRCKGSHHTALCKNGEHPQSSGNAMSSSTTVPTHFSAEDQNAVETAEVEAVNIASLNTVDAAKRQEILLMCREVEIAKSEHPELKEKVLLFVDPGSHRSYIDQNLAERLKLPIVSSSTLHISSFGARIPKKVTAKITEAGIVLTNGELRTIPVATMDYMTTQLQVATVPEKEIQRGAFSSCDTNIKWSTPQILLGADECFAFIQRIEPTTSGLYAIYTHFRLILAGKTGQRRTYSDDFEETAQYSAVDVTEFWDLECLGIKDFFTENEDEKALKLFQETLERDDTGSYVASWPWRESQPILSNNFGLCLGRLRAINSKFTEHPELLKSYDAVFQEQLTKGIIEEVPRGCDSGIVNYLPHQAVLTPHKSTTKLRVVFDASAKTKRGQSLNEALYRGPVILPNLGGILLRWRHYRFIVLADVEKAFLQIGLNEVDRNSTRFLWLRDVAKPVTPDNVVHYRYKRVLFGVISSPFLLAAVLQHHFRHSDTLLAPQLLDNLYVDNVIFTTEDKDLAVNCYSQIKQLFKEIHMNIREFTTNEPDAYASIPAQDRNESNILSVLGLRWKIDDDIFILKTRKWPLMITKRTLLQFIASHFDPLAFMVPILLPLKRLSQNCLALEVTWTEKEFFLLRYTDLNDDSLQLHVFVDASKIAYSAAVYGRVKKGEEYHTRLLFAKSRLMPIKRLTIPRAELMAALIGARALKFVHHHLGRKEAELFGWSDSKCALAWIRGKVSDSLPRFIKNRVLELQDLSIKFRYVPTDSNPADIGTRGISVEEFDKSELWWSGPEWLRDESSCWPVDSSVDERQPSPDFLSQEDPTSDEACNSTQCQNTSLSEASHSFVKVENFSSWNKLVSTVRPIFSFLKAINLRCQLQHQPFFTMIHRISLRSFTELFFIKVAQQNISEADIVRWQLKQSDEGIWYVHGRLGNVIKPSRFPVFLPTTQHITKLIILQVHEQQGHSGVSQTLANFRTKYWTEKGQRTVRKILNKECLLCRRWSARPFQLPPMPNLPAERVNRAKPFQHTAIDYAGPILVKEATGATVKRWVALFTCLVTRAVHLECAIRLSSAEFLAIYKRFTSRRGSPETVLTDKGSQFIGANELVEAKWEFITSHAPWKGGAYERLIGLMKSVLKKAIGKRFLSHTELANLIVSTEGILNNRPIIQVSDDSFETLRPIDFLLPQASLPIEPQPETNDDDYIPPEKENSVKQIWQYFKKTEDCLERFWFLWQTEYLNHLLENTQIEHQQSKFLTRRTPKVGEVVLLHDEDAPRSLWKLAQVTEVPEGTEHQIRTAKIRMANNRILERPINLLYPLELHDESSENATKSTAYATITICVRGVNSTVEFGIPRNKQDIVRYSLPHTNIGDTVKKAITIKETGAILSDLIDSDNGIKAVTSNTSAL